MPSTIERARRYYLLKRRIALARDESIEAQWHAKQDEEPGTALPASFPFLSLLGTFYTTVEDLDGADVEEIRSLGLTQKQSCAVVAAAAELV